MLLIATSDKGGTGRSVTGSNVAYRRALQGDNVCFMDFDFGSPTAGAIFGVSRVSRGTTSGEGTHSYLLGRAPTVEECDVWSRSDRQSLRPRPPRSRRLVLVGGLPGRSALGRDGGGAPGLAGRCRPAPAAARLAPGHEPGADGAGHSAEARALVGSRHRSARSGTAVGRAANH